MEKIDTIIPKDNNPKLRPIDQAPILFMQFLEKSYGLETESLVRVYMDNIDQSKKDISEDLRKD